jgi:hypothetical protein
MFVGFGTQQPMRVRHTGIRGLSGITVRLHVISKTETIFGKK